MQVVLRYGKDDLVKNVFYLLSIIKVVSNSIVNSNRFIAVLPKIGLSAAPSLCVILYHVAVCRNRYMSGTVSVNRGNCIQRGSIIVIAMMPDRR